MSNPLPIMSGCWRCGQRGHGFRDCENRPIVRGKVCFLCGLPGYTKYECPRPACREIIRQDWLAAQALEEAKEETEEAQRVQEIDEPIPSGTPPLEPVAPVQEPATGSQIALKDALRSELEAFLANRLCGLAPSYEIRLRISSIEVVLSEHAQSSPVALVGALIDFGNDVDAPPPSDAQVEAEMPQQPPNEANEDEDGILDCHKPEWNQVLTLFDE